MLNIESSKDLSRASFNAQMFITDLLGRQWQLSQNKDSFYLNSQGPQKFKQLNLGTKDQLSYDKIAEVLANNGQDDETKEAYLSKDVYTKLLSKKMGAGGMQQLQEEALQKLIADLGTLGPETGGGVETERITSPRTIYHIDFQSDSLEVSEVLTHGFTKPVYGEKFKPTADQMQKIAQKENGYREAVALLKEKRLSIMQNKEIASDLKTHATRERQRYIDPKIDFASTRFNQANKFNPYIQILEHKIKQLDTKQPYDAFKHAYYEKCIASYNSEEILPTFSISQDLLSEASKAPGLSKGAKMRIELMALLYRDKRLDQNSFSIDSSASLGEVVKGIMNNITIGVMIDLLDGSSKHWNQLPDDIRGKLDEIKQYGVNKQPNPIAQFCNELYEQFLNTPFGVQIIIAITILPIIPIFIGFLIHNRVTDNNRSASAADAIINYKTQSLKINSNDLVGNNSKSLRKRAQIHPDNAPRPRNDASTDPKNDHSPG